MKKLLLALFLALVTVGAQAQNVPQMGVDASGTNRNLYVRNPADLNWVTIGYFNSSTDTWFSSGSVSCAALPALTGDVTTSAASCATTVGKIGGQAIALAGGFSTSGAFSLVLTATGATNVTLPTSGTLATTTGVTTAINAAQATAMPSATASQIYVGTGAAGAIAAASNVPAAALTVALPNISTATLLCGTGAAGAVQACSIAANTLLGATALGAPVALTINGGSSCSTGLTWTNGTGIGCASAGTVTSVSNSDSTLTISPTAGAVVASLNLAHANTWSALQTFNTSDIAINGGSATAGLATVTTGGVVSSAAVSGDCTSSAAAFTCTKTSGSAFGTAATANTGTSGGNLPFLNGTNTWSGVQTFGEVVGTVTTQSGTTYTLATTDCGTEVDFTSGSAVTVTIPATLTLGCNIAILQAGAGKVSVNGSAVTPATLHSAHSYTGTFAQWAIVGVNIEANSGGSSAVAVLTGDGS